MADRLEADNTKELVLHARQAMFGMLLVCAVVVVGVLFQDTQRVQRAIDDLEIVSSLAEHFSEASKSPTSLLNPTTKDSRLTTILLGERGASPEGVSAFDMHFNAKVVQRRIRGESIEYPPDIVDVVDKTTCRLYIEGSRRFIASDQREPLVLRAETARHLQKGTIWKSGAGRAANPWPISNAPTDVLVDFQSFWDMLHDHSTMAHVTKISPSLATYQNTFPVETPQSYQHDLVVFYSASSEPQPVTVETSEIPLNFSTSIAQENEAKDTGGVSYGSIVHPLVARRWSDLGVGAALSGECPVPPELGEFVTRNSVTLVPATIEYEDHDWQKSWLRRAAELGNISENIADSISSGTFAESFPDLERETGGLSSLTLTEMKEWLNERLNSEGSAVSVIGVSLSPALLRLVGAALIVATQWYAAVHLSEAQRRMARTSHGDPGASQPWAILYESVPGGTTALITLLAPVAATMLIVYRITEQGGKLNLEGVLAMTACAVSVMIAFFALFVFVELRRRAAWHRHDPPVS